MIASPTEELVFGCLECDVLEDASELDTGTPGVIPAPACPGCGSRATRWAILSACPLGADGAEGCDSDHHHYGLGAHLRVIGENPETAELERELLA